MAGFRVLLLLCLGIAGLRDAAGELNTVSSLEADVSPKVIAEPSAVCG